MNYVFVLAIGIGIVAGLRSLTPPAVVAWAAHLGWLNLNNSPLAFMGSIITVVIFSGFIPGYIGAGYFLDLVGRKYWLMICFAGIGISSTLFGLANTPIEIMACAWFTAFFLGNGSTCIYTYTPELYPTEIRTTAMGMASAWGRVGGILLLLAFALGAFFLQRRIVGTRSYATISGKGDSGLPTEITWEYYGKDAEHPDDDPDWHELTVPSADQQNESDALLRFKLKGKIELYEVEKDKKSRWVRGRITAVAGSDPLLRVDKLEIRVNCGKTAPPAASPPIPEAMANTTPLVLDSVFFPFGKEPRQFDAFYLGSTEAFSKKDSEVQLCFEMADPNAGGPRHVFQRAAQRFRHLGQHLVGRRPAAELDIRHECRGQLELISELPEGEVLRLPEFSNSFDRVCWHEPGCSSSDSLSSGLNGPCTRDRDCQGGLVCPRGVCVLGNMPDAGTDAGDGGDGGDGAKTDGAIQKAN